VVEHSPERGDVQTNLKLNYVGEALNKTFKTPAYSSAANSAQMREIDPEVHT